VRRSYPSAAETLPGAGASTRDRCPAAFGRLRYPGGMLVRLSSRSLFSIAVLAAVLAVAAAYAVLPAGPAGSAPPAGVSNLHLWLTARATGLVAYGLLSVQVSLGLLMSHPTNVSSWKLSKRVFPWHENLSAFLVAFLLVHVATIVLDPIANVDLVGALVPGLAAYRPIPVAVGTLALDAALLASVTARWTRILPAGVWLRLHRLALVAWLGGWAHGVLAGTDAHALTAWYAATGALVVAAAAWRYSVVRKQRRAAQAAPRELLGRRPVPAIAISRLSEGSR
jgi:methionine sulfoxide reductase heme-binding subunit